MPWSTVGLIGFGGALLVASLVSALSWDRQLQRTRQEITALRGSRPDRERRGASNVPDPVLRAVGSRALLTEQAQPADVLADLAGMMPADVRLDGVALTYGERLAFEIQCVAESPPSYDRWLDRLAESALFAGLEPGQETRGGGELRANVKATYSRGTGQ